MRESTAAVVCYDLTNAEHWEKAKKYVDEIKLRVEVRSSPGTMGNLEYGGNVNIVLQL